MKVLYLAPDAVPAPKGAGVRIPQTIQALRDLGHTVELLTPADPLATGVLPGVRHDTVDLGAGSYLQRMLAWRRGARQWLAGRSADRVQFRCVWAGAPALQWAQARSAPTIFEAHGLPSVELPQHYPRLYANPDLLDRLVLEEAAVLGGAHRLITHSRTGARFLLMRGVPAERIRIVPNCADPEIFHPPALPPCTQGALRVVYQGTLAPWQGLSQLIEALGLLRRSGLPVVLLVAGPRKARFLRGLRRLARQLRVQDQIVWLGALPRSELAQLLAGAHACAVPLPADPRNVLQGCSPIKVFEAMAAGRPILATRVPPLLELLEHGRTAHLVEASQAAALAEGLRWLATHLSEREELGRAARAALLQAYTPQHFLARWATALQGL